MTLTTSTQVPGTVQGLIDCRLDTIDRMLLGRLPRSDRMEVVQEVESQIFELLAQRGNDELTREDVLSVLGQLDPPEAYLPDEDSSEPLPRQRHRPSSSQPRQFMAQRQSRAGMASGILGITALCCSCFSIRLRYASPQDIHLTYESLMILWFGFVFITAAGSITWLGPRRSGPPEGRMGRNGCHFLRPCTLSFRCGRRDWFDWPVIVPDREVPVADGVEYGWRGLSARDLESKIFFAWPCSPPLRPCHEAVHALVDLPHHRGSGRERVASSKSCPSLAS